MSASAWPVYRGFDVRDLRMLARMFARFVGDPTRLRRLATVVFLLGIYAAGLLVRIPGVPQHAASTQEHWWFLVLLDFALTGGALGRGCVFSMGILGPLLLSHSLKKTRASFWRYVRQVIGLGLASLFIGFTLRARGLVAPGSRPFIFVCLIVAIGGIGLKLVDTYIVRLHGPSILYVNLSITLVVSLQATFTALRQGRHLWTIAAVVVGISFISISAYFLMRSRVLLQVKNIENSLQRQATLEIPAMDEPLIDSLSIMFLTLYVCIAGCTSLLLGWHSITSRNAPVLSAISIGVFALSWIIFLVMDKYLDVFEIIGGAGRLGFTDAHGYSIRMLNNFWIIPSCKAGRETEVFLKSKLTSVVKRSFLLFASWFAIALGLEYWLAQTKPSAVLFPFGPAVFVFILVMVVGNFSAMFRYLSSALNHFKQLLRGQSRVIAEMYPLGKADQQGRISFDQDFQQYWDDEKLADHMHDMLEWLKLARDVQLVPKRELTTRGRFRTALIHLAGRLVGGVILSFVVGVVCLMLYPDIGRRELVLVMVPLVVGPVVVPEAILQSLRQWHRKS